MLDQTGSGSLIGDSSLGSARKSHASALRALTKAFNKNPKAIVESIESQMAKDFGQTPAALSTGTCSSSMAMQQVQARELPEPCPMELAGWRHPRRPGGRGDRSCQSEGGSPSCRSGSSKHRWRQLGGVDCLFAGAPSSLLGVLQAHVAEPIREPDQRALRHQVGRDLSGKPEGPRELHEAKKKLQATDRGRGHGGNQSTEEPPGGKPPKGKGEGGKKFEGGTEQKPDK